MSLRVVVPLAVAAYCAVPLATTLMQPAPLQAALPTPAAPAAALAAMPPTLPVLEPKNAASPTSAPGHQPLIVSVGSPPRTVSRVAPVYPALARAGRVSGMVGIEILIGGDGRVRSARLLSGHPLLVNAAMDSVRQWVFQPALLNGEPVELRTQVEVNFQLK